MRFPLGLWVQGEGRRDVGGFLLRPLLWALVLILVLSVPWAPRCISHIMSVYMNKFHQQMQNFLLMFTYLLVQTVLDR